MIAPPYKNSITRLHQRLLAAVQEEGERVALAAFTARQQGPDDLDRHAHAARAVARARRPERAVVVCVDEQR